MDRKQTSVLGIVTFSSVMKEKAMFTLEVAGKAIAVTNADEEQARELFMSEDFKADLLSLKSESQPLWDGSAALTIRAASEDEMDAVDEVLEEEDEDDQDDDGEELGIDVVFLVEIDETDGHSALS
jgi:hypothetical protein